MEAKEGLTKKLARFIAETPGTDIPEEILEHTKVAFMDWLGVTIAGHSDPLVKKLINYSDLLGGNEQATIIGHGCKKSISHAALINGAASHVLDYDDTLASFLGHPSVTLFPSLLALSEFKEKKGSKLLEAYVFGLKAGTVVAGCAGLEHYMAGWHATSTLGYIASAAACARLLGLNVEETTYALGIAATQSSGLKRVFGSMCKAFHAGRSSESGLMAAMLASDGFTSAEDILEGQHGFFNVLKGEVNDFVVDSIGKTWEVDNLAQKYHASCHATHSPLEAAVEAIENNNISLDNIKEILVYSSQLALDAAGKTEPKTGLEGKFSIAYCIANAILGRNTGMQAFTDEKVNSPEIRELLQKTKVILGDDMLGLESRVEITVKSGESFSAFSDILQKIPPFDIKKEKIKEKFFDLCGSLLGETKAQSLIKDILVMDKVENMKKMIEVF